MKKIYFTILTLAMLMGTNKINAQLLEEAQKFVKQKTTSTLTQNDATKGVKEVLEKGTTAAVSKVSKVNGYLNDPQIKIPFPQNAKTIETKLRAVGLGKKVDQVVESMNRAAEDAATGAQPIFLNAIKGLNVQNAVQIVKGDNNAATQYLKGKTSSQLATQFKPVIQKSLDKVNATKYWNSMMTSYNKIPLVKKVNPDLSDYVTQKAIEGLFVKMGQEEAKIRANPAQQTSSVLKNVFGAISAK